MPVPPFKDNRLLKEIDDFYVLEKTCNRSMVRLSEKSKLRFTCKDDDIGSYIVNSRIKNKKIFEIMDCFCIIRNFGWNKIDKIYQMDDSLDEYDRVFVPKNEFRRNMNNLSLPVFDMIDQLSSKNLSIIEGNGIPVTQFPVNIQNSISGIIESINSEDKFKDGFKVETDLKLVRLQIDKNSSPGFRSYMFNLKTPQGVIGVGVNDYENWKSRQLNDPESKHYENKIKPLQKQKWNASKIGKTRISFEGYASPVEIFTEIASKYDFDFLCDRKSYWKKSKNVQYKNIMVSDFLERIENDFPQTKCQISSDDIVVIQAPMNPWRIYSARKRT